MSSCLCYQCSPKLGNDEPKLGESMEIFSESDFLLDPMFNPQLSEAERRRAAIAANSRFREWLAGLPTIYGAPTKDGQWSSVRRDEMKYMAITSNFVNDTHTAKIFCIEPIKREDDTRAGDFYTLACLVFDLSPRENERKLFVDTAKRLLERGK